MSDYIKAIVEPMVQPFLQAEGFELVKIEYIKEGNNWFLRLYVDKEDGIQLEDCSRISEYLSEQLDEHDPIPEAYFLEVSSAGAERPLFQLEQYRKAIGKAVYVKTKEAIQGFHEFEGYLMSIEHDTLIIKGKGKPVSVPFDLVANGRLAVII